MQRASLLQLSVLLVRALLDLIRLPVELNLLDRDVLRHLPDLAFYFYHLLPGLLPRGFLIFVEGIELIDEQRDGALQGVHLALHDMELLVFHLERFRKAQINCLQIALIMAADWRMSHRAQVRQVLVRPKGAIICSQILSDRARLLLQLLF